MATMPATAPVAAPRVVATCSLKASNTSHINNPAAAANWVFTNALTATLLAPNADPALNPNQPNQRMPAPNRVRGTEWGCIDSLGLQSGGVAGPTRRARLRRRHRGRDQLGVLHPGHRDGARPASGMAQRVDATPLGTPHSVGAGILWFGWFGFNAGSALGANSVAVSAFVNTQLAAAAGLLMWLVFEAFKEHVATTLGAASGAVAGMVAITPCAGYIGPMASLVVGGAAGLACAFAVRLKFRYGYDDSLDVLGVHGVGGIVGMLLLGFFAARSINPSGANGLFNRGRFPLLRNPS